MKLRLESSKTLAGAVAWAARALPQRPNVPVLGGILIEASAKDLTLSVFDYDVSARVSVPADVAEPGRVLLPGRVLAEIVKSLPDKPVEMALSGNDVILTCGAEFTLRTLPVDDYPTLPEPPETVGSVDADVLRDAVNQIHPATSKDDTLAMLTGMRLDAVGDQVTFAATDRYRIAARDFTWERIASEVEHAAVIPGRILHDIARGLGTGTALLRLGGGIAGVTCDGRTTTVRLLDPQFIDYNARLNLDMPTWATVDVAPLLEAVKRVSLVADKGAVRLAFSDGEVLIQAGGADTGRGRETIPADLDGEDVEVAFQPHWLVDALAAVGTKQVRVGMQGAAQPTLFVDDGDAPAFRCLLMALRLS